MLRTNLRRFSPLLLGTLIPVDYDKLPDTKTTAEMIRNKIETETPSDRLYKMFSVDEYGIFSPELTSVFQSSCIGLLTGALYGGFIKSKIAYEDFLSNNDATKFTSMQEAKQKLQTQVTIGFGKGAFMWGWRLALFTGSYVMITTAISVYRDKSSLWEYMAAGLITGALYKFKMGPKGMLVGGGLGLALGTAAGSISLAILYLTGSTMQEMRYWSYQLEESRNKAKIRMKSGEVTIDPLMEEHKRMLDENIKVEGEKKS